MRVYLSIILLFATCVSSALANEKSKEIADKIFVKNELTLTPAETMNLLVELMDSQPEASVRSTARGLITFGKADEMKGRCNADFFSERKYTQMQYVVEKVENVVLYLKEHKLEHYQVCKQEFADELDGAVHRMQTDNIIPDLNDRIQALSDHVGSLDDTHDPSYVKALDSYVSSQKKRNIFTGKLSTSKHAKDFDEYVTRTCEEFDEKLRGYVRLYEVISTDADLSDQVDKSKLDWIKKVQMCRKILKVNDYLMKESLKG